MLREKKKQPEESNGKLGQLLDVLNSIRTEQKELGERMEDLEKKTESNAIGAAALRMVNLTYDTDDGHLPELTRIPIQAARPLAIGMMLESILDPEVQSGVMPLSKKLRNYYLRLMRSVGGVHLGRGVTLATEQASSDADKAEELELGGD